jgi:hypothetical protein
MLYNLFRVLFAFSGRELTLNRGNGPEPGWTGSHQLPPTPHLVPNHLNPKPIFLTANATHTEDQTYSAPWHEATTHSHVSGYIPHFEKPMIAMREKQSSQRRI